MPAQLLTSWNYKKPLAVPVTDHERHELFAAYARNVATQEMPWLFPLLDATNARVIAGVNIFAYSIPQHPDYWFDVPEMMMRLQMVPWATDEETASTTARN